MRNIKILHLEDDNSNIMLDRIPSIEMLSIINSRRTFQKESLKTKVLKLLLTKII